MTIDTELARAIRGAVTSGAGSDDFGAIPVPESYVGAYLRAEDAETLGKLPRAEKRPSLALQVGEVPTPELAPDEVLIATFASSVNYNTVWSAIFEPVPTFAFLKRLGQDARLWQAPRHPDARGRLRRLRHRAAHRRRGEQVEARRPRARAPELRRARGARGP